MMRRALLLCTLFALAPLASCGSDSTGPAVDLTVPVSLTAVGSSSLTLIGGQAASVSVKVLNAHSTPLANVLVSFAALGGGSVGSPGTRTGIDGLATTAWTVASIVGQQTLTASIASTATSPTMTATFAATVTVTLTGTWTGTVGTQVLTLVLLENAGAVTGSGTFTNTPTGTRALTASGTLLTGTLNVTLSSGTTTPFSLRATVVGATMAGTLTGSGFTGEGITLVKQP